MIADIGGFAWVMILTIVCVICQSVSTVAISFIERNKPAARHCAKCSKLLYEAQLLEDERIRNEIDG